MADEKQDVKPNDSSPLEDAVASSSEADQAAQQPLETQTPPAEEGVTPEPEAQPAEEGKIPYDRFKEKVDEANWYKQQLEQLAARQQPPQPTPAPAQDPYVGMTPEEKVFWMKQREIAREEAQKVLQQNVSPQLEAAKQEFARMRVEQFHKDHPDIKPNSAEETLIADKIKQGYLPDDAYKIITYEQKMGQKQTQNSQQQQQKLEAKKKANVVSPQSVSSQSVPPPKETYEDELRRRLNTDWNGSID